MNLISGLALVIARMLSTYSRYRLGRLEISRVNYGKRKSPKSDKPGFSQKNRVFLPEKPGFSEKLSFSGEKLGFSGEKLGFSEKLSLSGRKTKFLRKTKFFSRKTKFFRKTRFF